MTGRGRRDEHGSCPDRRGETDGVAGLDSAGNISTTPMFAA